MSACSGWHRNGGGGGQLEGPQAPLKLARGGAQPELGPWCGRRRRRHPQQGHRGAQSSVAHGRWRQGCAGAQAGSVEAKPPQAHPLHLQART